MCDVTVNDIFKIIFFSIILKKSINKKKKIHIKKKTKIFCNMQLNLNNTDWMIRATTQS